MAPQVFKAESVGIELSSSQCFPENYAFDRYIELLRAFEETLGLPNNQQRTAGQLRQTGFEHLHASSLVPSFLEPEQRRLPSLVLEAIGGTLTKQGICSAVEMQANLMELRLFGNEPGTLISAPSG